MFGKLFKRLFSRGRPIFIRMERAPLCTDDNMAGFVAGSRWIDATTDVMYASVHDDAGQAVWLVVQDTGISCPNAIGPTGVAGYTGFVSETVCTGLDASMGATGVTGPMQWDLTGPDEPCGTMPKLSMWGPDDEPNQEIGLEEDETLDTGDTDGNSG